jgi:AAA domain
VTTGGGWPGPLGNALVLSAEDGLADTIRPRLDQFGGDPERVWAIQAVVHAGKERLFNLQSDLEVLEAAITETGASVVVIDPLSAYLGRTNTFKDSEVRALLAPLAAMAERTGVTVIGILHLTKDTERQAVHRALGSIALTAAPRAVFAVAMDSDSGGGVFFCPSSSTSRPSPQSSRSI